VLLDAPCSGTGTLRKNPEIAQRLLPQDLPLFAAAQRELLRAGLELLEPGGTLVYVTCSLEPEENDAVVEGVMALRADVRVCRPDTAALPLPLAEALGSDHFLRVAPGQTNDGFTAVVLRRDR
jgi:16S rRNA (cytosine967-C5)-methyltransferase